MIEKIKNYKNLFEGMEKTEIQDIIITVSEAVIFTKDEKDQIMFLDMLKDANDVINKDKV